jgi:hypothetical protein
MAAGPSKDNSASDDFPLALAFAFGLPTRGLAGRLAFLDAVDAGLAEDEDSPSDLGERAIMEKCLMPDSWWAE